MNLFVTPCLQCMSDFSGHPGMENRWLSIYNVCLDLPSSPEMQNYVDRKSVSSTNGRKVSSLFCLILIGVRLS